MKPNDLIKLSYGIHMDSEFPPYRIYFGYSDRTVTITIDDGHELNQILTAVTKIKEKYVS